MWQRRRSSWVAMGLAMVGCVAWITPVVGDQTESALAKVTKAGELRAGWAANAPFAYRDNNGKLIGFSIEYVEEMGKALKVKVTWVEDKWATLVAGLAADRYEMIINANRTWSRLLVAEFTNPIALTKKGFLIRKADLAKFRTPDDLRNPKIKVATTLGDAASEALAAQFPEPQKVAIPDFPDSILGLASGKVDVVAADFGLLLNVAKEHPNLVVPPESTWLVNDFGLYVKQGDQIWLNWVNWFIRESKLNGTVDRLIKKYDIKGMDVAR